MPACQTAMLAEQQQRQHIETRPMQALAIIANQTKPVGSPPGTSGSSVQAQAHLQAVQKHLERKPHSVHRHTSNHASQKVSNLEKILLESEGAEFFRTADFHPQS